MQEDCSLKLGDISQHAFCISLFVMAFMLSSQYFQLTLGFYILFVFGWSYVTTSDR